MDTSFYLGACFGIFLMFVTTVICGVVNRLRDIKAIDELKNSITYHQTYKDQ